MDIHIEGILRTEAVDCLEQTHGLLGIFSENQRVAPLSALSYPAIHLHQSSAQINDRTRLLEMRHFAFS